MKALQYSNSNGGIIIFQQWPESSLINIDTENAEEISKVIIQEADGMIVKKGNLFTITWINNSYIFILDIYQGNMTREEVFTIAESVRKIN